jgi:hypothetical protein
MDALGVSQGMLERVTGHLRAGMVGPLDECQAVTERCHNSCSGCVDLHCDQAEAVVVKCCGKIDQFLVDKLAWCYCQLARFGIGTPATIELEQQGVPTEETPGEFGGGSPAGGGGGQPMAEEPPLVVEVEPVFGGNPPQLPGRAAPPELLPPPQEEIDDEGLPKWWPKAAPEKPRGGGPALPEVKDPREWRPEDFQRNMIFVQLLCQCGGLAINQAFMQVNNWQAGGAPRLPKPAPPLPPYYFEWEPPPFPDEGAPA